MPNLAAKMADRKEPPFFNDDSVGAFQYKLPFYDPMDLFIETLTGTCFELRVSPFEAVISVKAKIQRLEGIPVAQQHLIWNNLELDDEYCLHDYGIAEGCTLKLVLAMRGGPINTRRVTLEEPARAAADLMESSKEDGWDRSAANKQVTFVVYREGDQLNFFRVVDRGDGTLTPLSESLSGGGSVFNVYAEEEEDGGNSAAAQQSLENSITMHKMKLLKAKMEDMNLNKKPKKSAKLKPRPPVSPNPCSSPSSTRHHHRLFHHTPPQLNQPRHGNKQLPPIRDHGSAALSPPSAAASSPHLSVTRRAPPPFSSPSCYMLQEEGQCETCPPFIKIRPPPKVSRLDIGSPRFMRDCVYPQLPPLATRGPPEGDFEEPEPVKEAVGLGLLEELARLVEPTACGAQIGEHSDATSLNLSTQPEGDLRSQETESLHLLPPWMLGMTNMITSRADKTQPGASFHISASSPSPTSNSPAADTRTPPQPHDSSSSQFQLIQHAQSSTQLSPGDASSHLPASPAASPPRLCGVKIESPGKKPEIISKKEARGITKMANEACKEPLGSLHHSELLASLHTRPAGSSRDGLRQSLGLTSGHGIPGSKLSSIPNNRLRHGDVIRQMSPLNKATAAFMGADGPASGGGFIRTAVAPAYRLPPVMASIGSKKSSKHCFLCRKKTGLATSYLCRCGHNFCATHRYAETHDCTYDYKSAGRRFLQETNPLISAPKLPKI